MTEKEVGCIIITKGNGRRKTQKQKKNYKYPYGIITERDLYSKKIIKK